jgi:hypothetical protein|tara:strand:- start:2748 stop:3263 length:516 start_codon:yes stop_codon:yes gene_type:complete
MLTVRSTTDTSSLPTHGNAVIVKVIGARKNTYSVWLSEKQRWLECLDGRRSWFKTSRTARVAARDYNAIMFDDSDTQYVPETITPKEEPVTHLRYNSAEHFSVPNMFHNFMRFSASSWNSDASSIAAKLYGLASLFPDVPGGILLKMAQGNHDMVRIEERAVIIDISGGEA